MWVTTTRCTCDRGQLPMLYPMLVVIAGAVAAPIADVAVGLISEKHYAVAAFLVVACHVVASYHRTAVASRRVAVPEQLHEVARRRFVPDAVGCPFLVG